MKKFLSFVVVFAVLLTLSGCGESAIPAPSGTTPTTTVPVVSTSAPDTTQTYPIGNLSFTLDKNTDVSRESSSNSVTTYTFWPIPGQACLIISTQDISNLSVSLLDSFITLTQGAFTDDYDKIAPTDLEMDIAGFPASGEIFNVQSDGKLYHYNVMTFTDTYYLYTFIYITLPDVSDSLECTLAYSDLLGDLEYFGPTPRK